MVKGKIDGKGCRYIALQNDLTGDGPLQKYFLGEKMHGADADIFTANMYLAEDRVSNLFGPPRNLGADGGCRFYAGNLCRSSGRLGCCTMSSLRMR